ncbi:MAG: ABC transporter permease, partial [Acidobacteriota bacterium]
MHTIGRDLRHAVRALLQMRGTAMIAVLTLALGIGATTTMFSVVYALLFRPPPFDAPERLVILFKTSQGPRDGLVRWRWSMPDIEALRATVSSFASVASFTGPLLSTSGRGDPAHLEGEAVSSDYFRTLRIAPAVGRAFGPADDTRAGAQPVALIGWRVWQQTFAADPAALGATIVVNGLPLTIVGIMPKGFTGLSGKAELWISPPMAARLTYAEYLSTPQNFISVVARLKDGVTLRQAEAEMAAIGSRFAGPDASPDTVWSATSVPLSEARIDTDQRQSAFVLLAAAVCVLLISCVNVACLLLAQARVRRREFALRLAIGAGYGRLVQQLLTEGLVMAVTAGVCGTVLAAWGAAVVARNAPAVIASGRNSYAALGGLAPPGLDAGVWLFAVTVTLATTLMFALVPALAASRLDLVTALKQDDRSGQRRGRGLSILVIVEIATACLLLTSSGLLIESFARIESRRHGFVADGVLTFWVRPPAARYPPPTGPATLSRLLTHIQAVPGVASAAVNRCTPFSGCSRSLLFLPGRPTDPALAPSVGRHYISEDYFQTLGIPLIAGRTISERDRANTPPVAVVNESGARRFWPGANPIGQRVWFAGPPGPFSDPAHAVEIVGVVGDAKYGGVDQPDRLDRADFYTSYLQFAYPDTMVIVKSQGEPGALLPAMRRAVAAVDPALPIYDAMTLDQRVDAAISRPRFNATLAAGFAGAALLLAAMGVYGMLSYSVSARMRDIGVYLALGADARRVMRMILGEGLRLAAAGTLIGLAASFLVVTFGQRWLADAARWDPRLLAAAAVVMLAVA